MSVIQTFAPGRVNVIGDHIDYLGGHVLPMALKLGTHVRLQWIDGDQHRAISSSHGQARWPVDNPPAPCGHWYDYLIGALGDLPQATRIEIVSDLPQGAGLSSSASLLVALVAARAELMHQPLDRLSIARRARQIEIEHIGLKCGIMDQYASAFGQKGHALLLDCQAQTHQPVQLKMDGAELWAIDSKAPRSLAGSVYNERVAECAEIGRLAGTDDFFAIDIDLPEPLDRRLKHIQSEQKRVHSFATAAAAGDLRAMGQIMNDSHRSLSEDYEVAGPALDKLQSCLANTVGCFGARMTGGGFGGCVIALVRSDARDMVQHRVALEYGDTQWIQCKPSDGARVL